MSRLTQFYQCRTNAGTIFLRLPVSILSWDVLETTHEQTSSESNFLVRFTSSHSVFVILFIRLRHLGITVNTPNRNAAKDYKTQSVSVPGKASRADINSAEL